MFFILSLFRENDSFYTRPQDGFIEAGSGGGIGWGLSEKIENAVIDNEIIIDDRAYHTIKEVKNGLGPAPIKTAKGWLQLAHGVLKHGGRIAVRFIYVSYGFKRSFESYREARWIFPLPLKA